MVTLMAAYIGLDPGKDFQWVTDEKISPKDLFIQGKIDAFLAAPPEPQDLRARKIGHTILATTVDRPWSQYYCCMLAGHADYVSKYPVATKRVMRATAQGRRSLVIDPSGWRSNWSTAGSSTTMTMRCRR